MTTHPTDTRDSRAHHPTPDPNGPQNGSQGPLSAAYGAPVVHGADGSTTGGGTW